MPLLGTACLVKGREQGWKHQPQLIKAIFTTFGKTLVMDYKKGYDLTIDNAKGLMEASEKAAEVSRYGLACSLNILAAEELVKATCIMIKHYVPNAKITGYKKIFLSHDAKHKEFKRIVEFSTKVSKESEEMLTKLKAFIDVSKPIEERGTANQKRLLQEIKSDYEWFNKTHLEDFGKNDKIHDWLKDANDKKNNGLYVGEEPDRWISPSDITKDVFDEEKTYTAQLLVYANWCLLTLERFKELQTSKAEWPYTK